MSRRRPSGRPKGSGWAVAALAALLFGWNLGGHDLWAPDEPYFAEGAREMVADGEWVVPHVNGVVTTDKPPLFFWTIALLSLPAGEVTPWTARLPSALAALGTLLLVLRLGRRLGAGAGAGGGRTAALAGLVLATTLMFWEKARWAQIDALLCCLIWVALSAFEAWRAGEAGGRRAGLLFWLAAALAVLAKGPVGLLLPLGIALTALALDRRLGDWRRFAPAAGPLLFAAVAGAWIAATLLFPSGDYSVWGALREHFVDRGLHGLHHEQPPWYYLEVLPLQLLPWSGLVPGALLLAWRRRDGGDRLLLAAVFVVVVFFSVSTEKRDLYVLPAVPAFALLIGRFLQSLLRRAEERQAATGGAAAVAPESPVLRREAEDRRGTAPVGRRWLFGGQAVVAAVFILAGVGLPIAARGRSEVPYWMAVALAVVLAAAGLATFEAWRRRSLAGAALAPAAGFAAAYLFVASFVYGALEPVKSARPFSERLAAAAGPAAAAGRPVVAYDLGNLPEAFAFYTGGLYTVETMDPELLARHLARSERVWAVVHRPGLARLPAELRRRLRVVAETRLSRRDVLLVTNRPPDPDPG